MSTPKHTVFVTEDGQTDINFEPTDLNINIKEYKQPQRILRSMKKQDNNTASKNVSSSKRLFSKK